MPPADEDRLLPLPAVLDRVGLGKTAVYALIKTGAFPPPVKIGRASLWSNRRISAWIDEQVAA